MTNEIAIIDTNALYAVDKKGNKGSFALAMAYATREQRAEFGQGCYAKWLENGNYNPMVADILVTGLVPKAAMPYVTIARNEKGDVTKAGFIQFCQAISAAVSAKGKELKGKKAFVFGIVDRTARGNAQAYTIEA